MDEYLAKMGETKGPLHGLPVSLKDSFNVAQHSIAMRVPMKGPSGDPISLGSDSEPFMTTEHAMLKPEVYERFQQGWKWHWTRRHILLMYLALSCITLRSLTAPARHGRRI